jgi:hypothetical protein
MLDVLDDRLDDEVARRDLREVVLEVARRHEAREGRVEERRGAGLERLVEPPWAKRLRAAGLPSFASLRFGGTMSRSSVSTPALARWAAMPLPMTPAPITPTRRIGLVMQNLGS